MKKFWEKHDLFKVTGILVIITVILTWMLPLSYWTSSGIQVEEVTRVGLFDFFSYGLLGMNYFTPLVTFVFVLGGFYQVLSKTTGYQNLTSQIAKLFKGKEIPFVLIVSFVIAALAAVINDYYVIITFIPFIISIMSKMKLDKITGFVSTFGSIFIGFIGSIYGGKVAGISINTFLLDKNYYIWYRLGIFVFAFAVFSFFTISHLKKKLKTKKVDEIKDLFDNKPVTTSKKTWPMAVIIGIFAVIAILAYLPWEQVFNIKFFTEITDQITSFKVYDAPIFGYILGTIDAFGDWDLFGIQVLMLVTAFVVKFVYKMKLDELLSSFGEGLAKIGKVVALVLFALLVLEFTVMFPVLPGMAEWIMNLTSKFNILLATLSGFVASIFTTEYQYTVSLIGTYLTGTYQTIVQQLAIMLQSIFGIMAFVTPASVILLMGLSYLDIRYKDWIKYIWKFLVVMTLALTVLMYIIIK